MKANSICFSGFSREDESTAMAMFSGVNQRLSNAWSVENENDAELVVIDMDTVYGYMTWLKAQSAGKKTVAVTTSERSDADYLLSRPLRAEGLYELLNEISLPTSSNSVATPTIAANTSAMVETSVQTPAPAQTSVPTAKITTEMPVANLNMSAADEMARITGQRAAMPPLQAASAAPQKLFHFLKPGVLKGPKKLQLSGAPDLVIDPDQQLYYGGQLLKPLMPYATSHLGEQDFLPLSAAELAEHQKAAGAPQPLSRLQWLAHLLGHAGELSAGAQRNEAFHLSKWPASEREFPKHFRIATVMIKAPIKLGDVATQTGASLQDVIDFVNANIATGHIRI